MCIAKGIEIQMDSYKVIKAHENINQVEFRKSSSASKYKDDLVEVTEYSFLKGFGLVIEPVSNDMAVKIYYIVKGLCYNAENREVLQAGDMLVVRNDTDYMTLIILEDAEVLLHAYQEGVYNDFEEGIRKKLDALTRIQQKDSYTDDHCRRVSQLVTRVALKLGYSGKRLYCLRDASRFHDIGKVFIRDQILQKPDKLNNEEYTEMKKHAILGKELIQGKFADEIFRIISQHHERIDGSGYPCGLKDEAISEEGRILAICDSYDAMIADRIYKTGKSKEAALEEIRSLSGIKYDARLAEVFIEVLSTGYLDF